MAKWPLIYLLTQLQRIWQLSRAQQPAVRGAHRSSKPNFCPLVFPFAQLREQNDEKAVLSVSVVEEDHIPPGVKCLMHDYMQLQSGNELDRHLQTMTVDLQVEVAMLGNIEAVALALLSWLHSPLKLEGNSR